MQGSMRKKVKECKRVTIACLLPCHRRSGKDLIWMWRNKGPLVLISVCTVLEFLSLSCISEVLCNLPLPFPRAGALNRGGRACLLQSHLLTVRVGLRTWWVLRVWLGNCSLAESTPMEDNQSCPRERGTAPIIWKLICDTMPIVSRMAEMVGKSLLEQAGFPRNGLKNVLLPKVGQAV